MDLRIGIGYDAHRLVPGRNLVLAGVTIPHSTGLLGHSDADVAIHAVIDAVLGALALGDIGRHFPDSDEQYRDADSAALLTAVLRLPELADWRLGNLDLVIVAQKPKLLPFVPAMRERLAALFHTRIETISIKGKTTETLGFTGREEGISATAVVLLKR